MAEEKNQAITITRPGSLAPFAPDPEAVKKLAAQFVMTLSYRGADKLTYEERIALASASLAYNLSPAMGEIWAIPNKGLMIGRAGWVKKLNELGTAQGFTWWPSSRMMQNHEMAQYDIPDGATNVRICEIRRSDWLKTYSDTLQQLGNAGMKMDYSLIIQLLGPPPVVAGVGFIRASEANDLKNSAMPLKERAEKRAFAQACKQFVHLPFDFFTEGDFQESEYLVERETAADQGKKTVVSVSHPDEGAATPRPAADEDVEEGQLVEQQQQGDLQVEDARRVLKFKQQWDAEIEKARTTLSDKEGSLDQNLLTSICIRIHSFFEVEPEKHRRTFIRYLTGKDSSSLLSQAEGKALNILLKDGAAISAVKAIVRQDARIKGQMDMKL